MSPARERAIVLEEVAAKVRECTLCRLHRNRTRAVAGEGPVDADLFLIGEAAGPRLRRDSRAGRLPSGRGPLQPAARGSPPRRSPKYRPSSPEETREGP